MNSAPAQSRRDHRVDFLRGLALAIIFVNHVPGNFYEKLTPKNFGFSDAAEIFVILAGFASAYAYFSRFERGEIWEAVCKAWRRAGVLYMSHVVTTVAAVALLGAGAGCAYITGFTLLQESVSDDMRGRTFSTLYTVVRLCLLLSLTLGPFVSSALGSTSSA